MIRGPRKKSRDAAKKRREDQRPGSADRGGRFFRKKVCKFCTDRVERLDYRDAGRLSKFTSERGKILPRRISGCCTRHQRQLARAIKRARIIALMPYLATA